MIYKSLKCVDISINSNLEEINIDKMSQYNKDSKKYIGSKNIILIILTIVLLILGALFMYFAKVASTLTDASLLYKLFIYIIGGLLFVSVITMFCIILIRHLNAIGYADGFRDILHGNACAENILLEFYQNSSAPHNVKPHLSEYSANILNVFGYKS